MMASSSGFPWQWSPGHQDYYYVTCDNFGNYVYHWYKQDSPISETANTHGALMPAPVSHEIRVQYPGFIYGTPEKGWYESLDRSYRMRTGSEAYQFFKRGKVFSMLHIQAASVNQAQQGNDNISVVQYGEHAFSQIRRFVIIDVRHGFVYACPISTYSGRGTLKPGCNPQEHAVVYFVGGSPQLLHGESLTKKPIAIHPAEPGLSMHPASRLQYGKAYPIEMNVKVKDVGDVIPEDISTLLSDYKTQNGFP